MELLALAPVTVFGQGGVQYGDGPGSVHGVPGRVVWYHGG